MDKKEFPSVYPYSFEEAKRLKELAEWKDSHKLNIACKDAIEEAIRRDFDGMFLKSDCAASAIAAYGYHRTAYVLANSLQQKADDGRFSRDNQDWAMRTFVPPDKGGSGVDRRLDFMVDSHPAALDGFVNQYRRAYQALGLFDHTHCLPDTGKQDFEGKVIVLSPNDIKESCLTPQSQLWLCTGGFGAHANSRGRAVFATNLDDGETAWLNREDIIGVLAESHLPSWAREKLEQLQGQGQTEVESPGMGGMEMQ